MNDIHIINIETYFMIVDLAHKHGKQPGESMQEEFDELKEKYPEKFRYLGFTDKTKSQFEKELKNSELNIYNFTKDDENNED